MHKICNLNEDSAIKHHYLPCPITKNMRARELFLKIMIPTPLECDVMKEKKTIKVECAFDRENMSNGKKKIFLQTQNVAILSAGHTDRFGLFHKTSEPLYV